MGRIVFSVDARISFNTIKKKAKKDRHYATLLDAIKNKIEIVKTDKNFGNPISKNLIPKEYTKQYKAKNLFRIELPSYWRMLYTLKSENITIIAFVLDIVDHKKYNKLFNYKKK